MVEIERVKKLLIAGVSPSQVASAVGCDPSYISQLMADETFAEEVTAGRIANQEGAIDRDGLWDKIELNLLKKLDTSVQYMYKPGEILSALNVVNKAVRRTSGEGGGTNNQPVGQQVVVLNLPAFVMPAISKNQNNEVVQVGERALVSMPSTSILRSLEARSQNDAIPALPTIAAAAKAAARTYTEDSV